jgi:hypothetical protein
MVLEKGLSSPDAVGAVRDRLHFLYARKSAIDELIHSLEEYRRCARDVPRKPPRSETADFRFQRVAL